MGVTTSFFPSEPSSAQALQGVVGTQDPSHHLISVYSGPEYLPSRLLLGGGWAHTHHELEGILNGPHYQALMGHFLL